MTYQQFCVGQSIKEGILVIGVVLLAAAVLIVVMDEWSKRKQVAQGEGLPHGPASF